MNSRIGLVNSQIGLALFVLTAFLQATTAQAAYAVSVKGADVETSVAPVCETQKQVERLASLINYESKSAVHAVNVEAQNPRACGIANMAFLRGERIGMVHSHDATFEIVEVLVVGLVSGDSVMAAKPAIYFSLLKIDERSV